MDEVIGTDITPEGSSVSVFLIELTDAELAEREVWAAEAAAREQAELDRVAIIKSAKTKLAELGLTIEEVQAVIGL